MPTAKQSCWTCKKRKIGCDRELPACNNCIRTRRHCHGYGLRLVWPHQTDGHRKNFSSASSSSAVVASPSAPAGLTHAAAAKHATTYFLNYTTADLIAAETKDYRYFFRRTALAKPTAGLYLRTALVEADEPLLSYYAEVISPMCSTTKVRNGFKTDVLPLVLSGQDPSSTALCKAMLAIAAHHRNDVKAAQLYKCQAISQLFSACRSRQTGKVAEPVDRQLAAALMLCMYSVFDPHEGNWHIHLAGAKSILGSGPCHSPFLRQWAQYYSVLGAFTQASHRRGTAVQANTHPQEPIIIGALGCSVEVFQLIQEINVTRRRSFDPKRVAERARTGELVKGRLMNLLQTLDPQEEQTATQQRRSCILATAELYRLAALLYAHCVHPTDESQLQRAANVEAACETLAALDVASSPWPVFVVACEARSEEQRALLVKVMDTMGSLRGVGNLYVMRNIVEGFWKQRDFQGSHGDDGSLAWWDFGDDDVAVPWFV